MHRLERLINLVAALLESRRPLTREDLHERVPGYPDEPASARRAFERDKEALRDMGIPLVLEPIDPGNPELGQGYRIPPEQYSLPDPGLEPDELAALHLAASAVPLDDHAGTAALWKLGAPAPPRHTGEQPPPVTGSLPGSEHLPVLFGAVAERRVVAFDYRGERREVEPWRLAFRAGHWYLAGFDRARGGERRFRLDRIAGPPAAGEANAFERPAGASAAPPAPWELGGDEEVTALVLVDADQAGWAVAEVGEERVAERRSDGSVVLSLAVSNRDALRSFVLGFLDHAEVLGPPELRDDMVAWLDAIDGATS